MNVYVVSLGEEYHGEFNSDIDKIFLSLDKAQKYADEKQKGNSMGTYFINNHEVIE